MTNLEVLKWNDEGRQQFNKCIKNDFIVVSENDTYYISDNKTNVKVFELSKRMVEILKVKNILK